MVLQEYKDCLNTIKQEDLDYLKMYIKSSKNIVILGNGGSSAIASHRALDYTKMMGKNAISFDSSARLSCYANDYGWDNAYLQFLKEFGSSLSLVILISSSGNSTNILRCAEWCRDKKWDMITLSGFKSDNKLRSQFAQDSLMHFWIPSEDWGVVECLHDMILHSVV